MSLNEALERGLETIPGCQTVCYVDMATGLVLATSSRKSRPQEVLDRVAANAKRLLQSEAFSKDAGDDRQILLFDVSGLQVYVRAKNETEHALCYICELESDPESASDAIMENRNQIAEAF